jgi:chitin disaccharide deacetylase
LIGPPTRAREAWSGRPGCCVVFHADDFGMNPPVTDGIIRGFTHGLLTSASLLANAPHASGALDEWRRLEDRRAAGSLPSARTRARLGEPAVPFELGIHLNLTQGRPLTEGYPRQLLDGGGCFCGIGQLFRRLYRRRPAFEAALRSELEAQVEYPLQRGFVPTHLNGHQYIELLPGLRGTLCELLAKYGIETLRVAREPGLLRTTLLHGRAGKWLLAHVKRHYAGRLLRDAGGWNVGFPDAFFGTSHAGQIDFALLAQFLARGSGYGLIEIALHPSSGAQSRQADRAAGWKDPLAHLRPGELALLTSPHLADLLHVRGISLGRLAGPARTAATKAA